MAVIKYIFVRSALTYTLRIFSKLHSSKSNLNCNYHFPIDLTPIKFRLVLNLDCNYYFPIDSALIGIPIGTKSIGKV